MRIPVLWSLLSRLHCAQFRSGSEVPWDSGIDKGRDRGALSSGSGQDWHPDRCLLDKAHDLHCVRCDDMGADVSLRVNNFNTAWVLEEARKGAEDARQGVQEGAQSRAQSPGAEAPLRRRHLMHPITAYLLIKCPSKLRPFITINKCQLQFTSSRSGNLIRPPSNAGVKHPPGWSHQRAGDVHHTPATGTEWNYTNKIKYRIISARGYF